MSMPTNLFVDTPEMEDESLHHLGNDVEAWPEEIITKLKERLPSSAGMSVMVKFMKKDDENGSATGSLIVNSADKVVVVPIIIKDFMLYPLDVMISQSKILPLTPDMFGALFQSNALFDTIQEYPSYGGMGRFEDGNLWNTIYPPSLGRYAYASAGYPILDAVSDTVDGSSIWDYLKNPVNAKTAARLLSGPHAEVITKLAALRPLSPKDAVSAAEKDLPVELAMLHRRGDGSYELLQNSLSMYHPSLLRMERERCHELFSALGRNPDDEIGELNRQGEYFVKLPEGGVGPVLAVAEEHPPMEAVVTGNYMVTMPTGVLVEGLVVTKVINFDMKPVNSKVFLGKTMSTIQEHIWGVPATGSDFKPFTCAPRVGQTGTFLYMQGPGKVLATMPVTVISVTDDLGVVEIKVMDLLGSACKLRINGGFQLDAIVPLRPGVYCLPKGLHWAPMEGFQPVSNSSYDYGVKTASAAPKGPAVTLISTGYNQYAMRGAEKYAAASGWDKGNLEAYQAKFILASLGASPALIKQAMDRAAFKGKCDVHGLNAPALASEKVAKARPLAVALIKHADSLKVNLFKETALLQELGAVPETPWFQKAAAYLENSQTVDSLLSLNFVTPANITKYVGKVPSLKATISHLAGCLIASRLGMKEIPESSASQAMMRLVDVVSGLEKLKAMQQVSATRS